MSFLVHAREYAAFTWKDAAGKPRIYPGNTEPGSARGDAGIPGAPEPGMLRSALRKDLNQGAYGGQLDDAERKALTWLEKASAR